jgi:hypothetical protein
VHKNSQSGHISPFAIRTSNPLLFDILLKKAQHLSKAGQFPDVKFTGVDDLKWTVQQICMLALDCPLKMYIFYSYPVCAHAQQGLSNRFVCRLSSAQKSPDLDI